PHELGCCRGQRRGAYLQLSAARGLRAVAVGRSASGFHESRHLFGELGLLHTDVSTIAVELRESIGDTCSTPLEIRTDRLGLGARRRNLALTVCQRSGALLEPR